MSMPSLVVILRPEIDHAARAALRIYAASTPDKLQRRRILDWLADFETNGSVFQFKLTPEEAHDLVSSVPPTARSGISEASVHTSIDWLHAQQEQILLTVDLYTTTLWGLRSTICGLPSKAVRQWLKIHEVKPI